MRELKEQPSILQKKLQAKTPVIVFSGGGTASKAPEIIYYIVKELLKTNLDFKFYWMGTTTPPFKKIQPFREIKDILPSDPRLIITGRVPREEAMQISNEANIFLTPSKREGCPMALIEAMRVGTIPITSDYNNGCKEIIQDNYNGFVIPHKEKDLFVKRIVDIIEHPSKYEIIYQNSFTTFKEQLSFDVWKAKMDSIISNCDSQHQKRMIGFDSDAFRTYRKIQEYRSKKNLRHILFHEYLPSALYFIRYYLHYKLKQIL